MAVAVAHDGVGRGLAVARLQLAHRLTDHGAADLPAADDGEHVVKVRQAQVGKVVQHEADRHGQPASLGGVGLVAQRAERLAQKQAGQRGQAVVEVVHGHKEGALLVAERGKVDLLGALVACHGSLVREGQDVRGDDAHDARVHLLRPGRGAGASVERDGKAARVVVLQVFKELARVPVRRLLEDAHHRGHVAGALGHCLKDIGHVAGQVVGGGVTPEGVAAHVLGRTDGACHRNDVLSVGTAVAPADVRQRVVAHGARALAGEVELVHLVAVGAQVRCELVVERPLAVKDHVGPLALEQVGHQVVPGLSPAGAAQHQHVVVEAGLPGVRASGVVGGEEQLAGIGGARVGGGGENVCVLVDVHLLIPFQRTARSAYG